MKQSSKVNYLFNVSYQIFALLVPLITTPYLSRVLGADGIGTYSYTYSIAKYFWLASVIGISTLGTKTIGIWQESKEKRSDEFWNILSLKAVLSTVMLISYFIYVVFAAKNKTIAALQSIYLFGAAIDISWFYQGMEDFKKISIRNFITKILSVICIFLFVKNKNDLPIYIICHAGFLFLGILIVWFPIKKYIYPPKFKNLKTFKWFLPALILFLPNNATEFYSVIDKSMIGWITGSMAQNGYYEQAFKMINMLMTVITTLSIVMVPKISREFNNGNKDVVIKALSKSFKFTFFLGMPMSLGLVLIAPIFVPWFFGNDFSEAIPILQILSFLFIFTGISSVTGIQYLISTNQTIKHIIIMLCGLIVNVVLNIIFISKYQAIGAAIGSFVSEATIMILELAYLHFTKQYHIKNFLINSKNFTISTLIMGLAGFVIIKLLPSTVLTMAIAIFICAIVYIGCLILLKEEFIIDEIKTIINKINRHKNTP